MMTKTGFLFTGMLVGMLVVSPWEGSSKAATGPATIRVTTQQQSYVRVDVGAEGKSPGDMEIIRHNLFNRNVRERPIGRSELICTFVDRQRSRVCRGTYFLPKGKLIVGGSLLYRQFFELAVLGGTGLFDNARGSLVTTRMGVRPVRDRLVFRLVG